MTLETFAAWIGVFTLASAILRWVFRHIISDIRKWIVAFIADVIRQLDRNKEKDDKDPSLLV